MMLACVFLSMNTINWHAHSVLYILYVGRGPRWGRCNLLCQPHPAALQTPPLHQREWAYCPLWQDQGNGGRQDEPPTTPAAQHTSVLFHLCSLSDMVHGVLHPQPPPVAHRRTGNGQTGVEKVGIWLRAGAKHELCPGSSANPLFSPPKHEEQSPHEHSKPHIILAIAVALNMTHLI